MFGEYLPLNINFHQSWELSWDNSEETSSGPATRTRDTARWYTSECISSQHSPKQPNTAPWTRPMESNFLTTPPISPAGIPPYSLSANLASILETCILKETNITQGQFSLREGFKTKNSKKFVFWPNFLTPPPPTKILVPHLDFEKGPLDNHKFSK